MPRPLPPPCAAVLSQLRRKLSSRSGAAIGGLICTSACPSVAIPDLPHGRLPPSHRTLTSATQARCEQWAAGETINAIVQGNTTMSCILLLHHIAGAVSPRDFPNPHSQCSSRSIQNQPLRTIRRHFPPAAGRPHRRAPSAAVDPPPPRLRRRKQTLRHTPPLFPPASAVRPSALPPPISPPSAHHASAPAPSLHPARVGPSHATALAEHALLGSDVLVVHAVLRDFPCHQCLNCRADSGF